MSFNKSLCVALGVLAATSVMAYEQSFETGTTVGDPLDLAGWGGYGTYSNTPAARVLNAGVPLTSESHNIHLAVDGWVTNTLPGTANSDAQLDMLVKVALPDEALSGMTDEDAKFAMAIDSNGELKYWNGNWTSLGTPAYEEGTWIRVAVIYDYAGKRCKVSVDGNPCVTATGYKAASGGTAGEGGPWYPLIKTASTISSLKVVGTTALDDVKVAYGPNSEYTPQYIDPTSGQSITVAKTPSEEGAADVAVPLSWFDKNNVTTNAVNAPDTSGMTIADKYVTGLDPNDGSKFEMAGMTMTKVGDVVKAVVTVPATTLAPGYTLKVQTKNGASGDWDAGTAPSAGGTATITLPSGSSNVSYFRMVVEPTASNP